MATRKPKKTSDHFIKALNPRDADQKYLGDEPYFPVQPDSDQRGVALARSFAWYNRFYGKKDAKELLAQYCDHHDRPNDAKLLRKVEEKEYIMTFSWLARMTMRGLELTEHEEATLENEISRLLKLVNKPQSNEAEKDEKPVSNRPNVQEIMRDKAREAAGELDGVFDDFLETGKVTQKTVDLLAKFNVMPQHIPYIVESWKRKQTEYEEVAEGKDKDLNEAYSHMGKIKLRNTLKFIEQVMALAYDAKVNYHDTMTTVRPWDVIIHNYLLDRRIVIPQYKVDTRTFDLVGGYVKEPNIGMNRWVVSFDLNSLYPHLIMQYNISPETFVMRCSLPSIDKIISTESDYRKSDEKNDLAIAANGCTYRKDKQGFLPALMEKMYNDRVEYKKKMIEAKKRYEETKSHEDEMLIARYHNLQMAKKIQLNSAYGALGNRYFRWFSFNNAEAITMSGQLSIRWIECRMNEFMNKVCKTNDVDYVIASDTDSIYVTFDKLIPESSNELNAVKLIDKFCESKIQPYLDKCYQDLATKMNAYQQKMQMKRETIANKGIWKAKKMYILNAWNVEGVQYSEPKLKIQGIEAVRSSTPHACREKLKEAFKIIMNKDEETLQKFIENFRSEFVKLSFEEVAFPRGVKDLGKYRDSKQIYKLATPIHVKGSLIFNQLLKDHNIKNIPPIQDGDKIKFAYLKTPNKLGETVIATADYLPKEFGLDSLIDREKQFEKSFLEPMKSITEVIDWKVEKTASLEDFFT